MLNAMNEIIFVVETAPEGGLIARALGCSVFTEGADMEEIHRNVRDAVICHFEESERPKVIRLHMVHDELIAV
jgi:hypothetical protein